MYMVNVIDFTFVVGDDEKHKVRYFFNQSWGLAASTSTEWL